MWRRAVESKGEMRTSRCTPDSVLAQPCALWPLTSSVAGFEAGFVARGLFDHFDLELLALGPARIHAKQHARPIAAFGAAGAGMHFDVGVVGVRFAREERLNLQALGFRAKALHRLDAFFLGRGVVLHLAKLDERRRVVELLVEFLQSAEAFLKIAALAHDLLRVFGVVPKVGVFDRAFSSSRRRSAVSTSKMPPQQSQGLLDFVFQRLRFGAHVV